LKRFDRKQVLGCHRKGIWSAFTRETGIANEEMKRFWAISLKMQNDDAERASAARQQIPLPSYTSSSLSSNIQISTPESSRPGIGIPLLTVVATNNVAEVGLAVWKSIAPKFLSVFDFVS
jgi:hypothetical protein